MLHCHHLKLSTTPESQSTGPECITQTDSVGPTHFSSSREMSVPSDALHSPGKHMSAPKETYGLMCVSVLLGDTRSAHRLSQHKQKQTHAVGQAQISDQCILMLL